MAEVKRAEIFFLRRRIALWANLLALAGLPTFGADMNDSPDRGQLYCAVSTSYMCRANSMAFRFSSVVAASSAPPE